MRGDSSISLDHVMNEIKSRGKPEALAGMARFGIQTRRLSVFRLLNYAT
jgi:hypothetical protein